MSDVELTYQNAYNESGASGVASAPRCECPAYDEDNRITAPNNYRKVLVGASCLVAVKQATYAVNSPAVFSSPSALLQAMSDSLQQPSSPVSLRHSNNSLGNMFHLFFQSSEAIWFFFFVW